MSKLEAVIFDWAGTMVDYGCFAPVQAFVEVFRHFKVEPMIDEVREPMGVLKKDHIRMMLKMERLNSQWNQVHGRPWTEDDVEQMHNLFENKLMGILDKFAEPKPYALETAAYLRGNHIKIGSTTGYTDKMMAIVAPKAKEQGYEPDVWFSPDAAGGRGRPYPYMIYRNMEALAVSDVAKTIKVGDTVADIKEGLSAGIKTVGIIEGSSILGMTEAEYQANAEKATLHKAARETYEKAGADFVISNLSELPALIECLL